MNVYMVKTRADGRLRIPGMNAKEQVFSSESAARKAAHALVGRAAKGAPPGQRRDYYSHHGAILVDDFGTPLLEARVEEHAVDGGRQ